MNYIYMLLGVPLGYLMYLCYIVTDNYGYAIVLFTLLSKIVLFPVSILVQKNSIKMVKIQPELDEIKLRYAGDKDRIADEQIKVFEREKYSPLLGMVPLLIQIPLVLGLIHVIYNPLKFLLHLDDNIIQILTSQAGQSFGIADLGSAAQLRVVEAVNNPAFYKQFAELKGIDTGILSNIQNLNLDFFGLNLSVIPPLSLSNLLILIPVCAGLSALLLCIVQNKINVLQQEQSTFSQWGMTIFMVVFSTYFTFIVPAGVGLYWIFGNLFGILNLLLVNKLYDPKKYIDYSKRLPKPVLTKEKKKELQEIRKRNKEREKADKKRFFSEEFTQKRLVFYSEKSGFYKYYELTINYILENSDIVIHYVTSDPEDAIFSRNSPRIIPYYIGDKALIAFMMKMDADIVVMTMPDLQQFHIKRSLVRKDIEYIYMFHYPLSTHMVLRKGALDYYDTIFCVGEFQFDEIRATERLYNLPEKKLVLCGYGQLEMLYESYCKMEKTVNDKKKVLIAPSWQPDNILDSCIDDLLSGVLGKGYNVVVRPHPEYVKRYSYRMEAIVNRYMDYNGGDLTFELDFSSNKSIYDSDIVITDWSGTAYEFSFVTKKPSVFINTPMKVNNPEYEKIDIVPLEILLRDKIGVQLDVDQLKHISHEIDRLFASADDYQKQISMIVDKYIANFGRSGEVSGQYIINRLKEIEGAREDEG